jgi:hypothetical protein
LGKINLQLNLKSEDCAPLSINDFKLILLAYLTNPYFKINNRNRQKDYETNIILNIANTENNYLEISEKSALDMYMYYLFPDKYTHILKIVTKLIEAKLKVVVIRKYLKNKEVDICEYLLSYLIKSCTFLVSSLSVKDEINFMYVQHDYGNDKSDIFDIKFLLPTIQGFRDRTDILNRETLFLIPLELYKTVDGIFCNRNFDFKIMINGLLSSEKNMLMSKLIQIQSDSRVHLQKILLKNNLFIFKNQPLHFCIYLIGAVIFKIIDYLSISNSAILRVSNRGILIIGKIIYFFLYRARMNPLNLNFYYRNSYLKNRVIKFE